jgi:hypothetical protein
MNVCKKCNNNNNNIKKSKLPLIGEKSKICTFAVVMPLCGGKGYIHTYIHIYCIQLVF